MVSRRLLPVLAILLLASAARIVNAGHWPVWTDEGWSTWAASDHRLDVILDRISADRHPPLYFVTLSAWWTLAGDSRIALRFLAIASGILSTAVVWRIGTDVFGVRAGRYAALFFAVLPAAVYYSQEIRHYGWLVLAVSLMTLFFIRFLRRPTFGVLTGYTFSIIFMLYSLYIGALVLLVHVGIGLLAWRGALRYKLWLLGAWLAALLLYMPWLIVLSRQLNLLVDGIVSYPTTLNSLVALSGILLGGQLALSGSLYVLGACQIVLNTAKTDMRLDMRLMQLTVLLSGAGLFALLFIGNVRIGLLSARTLVFLTPFLMIVCGYGLSLIERRTGTLLAAAFVIVTLVRPEVIQPRLDYQSATQAVAAEYTPGDLVILENGWDDNAFRYELLLALGESAEPDIIRTLPWVDNRKAGQPVVPQVEDAIRAHPRVWIVNWLQPSQVIPFLDSSGDGFQRILTRETSTGEQYKNLYSDSTVRAVLYEKPAEVQWQVGEIFKLGVSDFPAEVKRGDHLHIDLWWTALMTPSLDYSASVFLLDMNGVLRLQDDRAPADQPTSRWAVGTPQFDRHTLSIPGDLAPGEYQLGVKMYWYGDLKPLPINGQPFLILRTVKVS